jgi:hypothetical protein
MPLHDVNTRRRLNGAVLLGVMVFALAACGTSGGSGSGDANTLLKQTFSGAHKVSSGSVTFALTVNPAGSRTLKGPISFSLGGPFQSLGSGKLPKSNFAITLSGMGKSGSVAVLSTGSTGYVTLQGTSYQLPQATFRKLESNFAQVASTSGGSGSGSGSGTLGKLGIQPLRWLRNPTIIGNQNVGGTDTTHIRSGVDVSALVDDLSTFLKKASSLGVSGASGLSGGLPAATRNQIVNAIRNPSVDVWTGTSDKTMRKLQVGLTLPVSGQLATLAGGANSAAIGLTIQYADLNQPQSIAAPSTVRPFSEFSGKLQSFMRSLEGGVAGGTTSGSGAGSGGASSATGGTASGVQSYSKCIKSAGNDVAKMQQCSALLSSG